MTEPSAANMTKGDINLFIFETVMGKCHHITRFRTDAEREWVPGFLGFGGRWKHSGVHNLCLKCGAEIDAMIYNGQPMTSPPTKYTTSLDAVREAEVKTVEKFGETAYLNKLIDAELIRTDFDGSDCPALADALTRCTAIVECWRNK